MVNPTNYFTGSSAAPICFGEQKIGKENRVNYTDRDLRHLPTSKFSRKSVSLVNKSVSLVKEYADATALISTRYPEGISGVGHVDLSNLGLKHLPPQIFRECASLQELDLSGNDIFFLPPELQNSMLERLNISGNTRLQPNFSNFEWLLKFPNLYVVANNMGFNFIPREWRGRFESNEAPEQSEWMFAETQLSDEGEWLEDNT